MLVFTTVAEMNLWVDAQAASGRSVGLVPTMGALHTGHLTITQRAISENDAVVVTVFVNPIQFNNSKDLEKYPRTFEADRSQLQDVGVDVMFFPSVDEIYPVSVVDHYDLDGLDAYMEGPNRPGHFDGVVQVVTRFFDIIRPTRAYFGEKDFQQLAIIRHMTGKLGYDVQVLGCETVRESDGLAMSSRNTLLTQEYRSVTPEIFKVLTFIEHRLRNSSIQEVSSMAKQMLEAHDLKVEYVELVDPQSLRPVNDDWGGHIQACIAVWAGSVRLIDNLKVK